MAFERLRFHTTTDEIVADGGPPLRGAAAPAPDDVPAFATDEAAARFYLDRLVAVDARPTVRGMRGPEGAEPAADLMLAAETATPLNTRLVSFAQRHAEIPVFGSKAVVEMTGDRQLLAVGAQLGAVEGLNPVPSLTAEEAIDKVAQSTGGMADLATAEPVLNVFRHPNATPPSDNWHLVWLIRDYPAVPAHEHVAEGHGMAPSMRSVEPRYDYLVDAHTGAVVYAYSAAPTLAPVRLVGLDESDTQRQFWGAQADAGFELSDPMFHVATYDMGLSDVDPDGLPANPVVSPVGDLAEQHRAAVTAHVYGRQVREFYSSMLGRDGIDGEGADLVSVVNCTYNRGGEESDEWANAVWWKGRMWYGQVREGDRLVSLARHLDIIAHELTHGVTATTSDLVYRDQSGALNESFSDIFGVIIKNWWTAPDRNDVTTWDWELGKGWKDGAPLRDLSDPTRTGDPAHMDDFDPDLENRDHGGVHTNSNIHNKAAYGILTARDEAGNPVFSVEEAAMLFYVTLLRLSKMADFAECRDAVIDSAQTMLVADDARRERGRSAIEAAYAAVGIG
jgi:bacillolysin